MKTPVCSPGLRSEQNRWVGQVHQIKTNVTTFRRIRQRTLWLRANMAAIINEESIIKEFVWIELSRCDLPVCNHHSSRRFNRRWRQRKYRCSDEFLTLYAFESLPNLRENSMLAAVGTFLMVCSQFTLQRLNIFREKRSQVITRVNFFSVGLVFSKFAAT